MQLIVRDVDEKIFRQFKAEAVREGLKLGKAVNRAMEVWLEVESTKTPKLSLLDLEPKDWGKGSERASEEIDKILYG